MENEKKTISEQEYKDVGITITDSEITRRLKRFKELIGNLRGECRPEILPFREICKDTNEQDKNQLSSTITSTYWKGWGGERTAIQEIKVAGYLNSETWKKRHESIRRVYGIDGISPTIPTGTGGGVMTKVAIDVYNKKIHSDRTPALTEPHHNSLRVREGFKIRRLTPIECERLQGFPDNWTEWGIDDEGNKVKMSDTQRYKQMGNAVTTNVIRAVGEKIACYAEKENLQ